MIYHSYPTLEALREAFEYDEGKLLWKIKPSRKIALKTEAGSIRPCGRNYIYLNGSSYSRARIVYAMVKDMSLLEMSKFVMIHLDGDTSNDQVDNLKLITQNQQARRRRKLKK